MLAPGRTLHLLKFDSWPLGPSCQSFLSRCMLHWQAACEGKGKIPYSHVSFRDTALPAAGMRSCTASCSCIIMPCVQALWVSQIWNIGVCARAKSTDFWWLTAWATQPLASLITDTARKKQHERRRCTLVLIRFWYIYLFFLEKYNRWKYWRL